MKEWTKDDVQNKPKQVINLALYFYTPLCGTCQVASKMLDVVEKVVPHFEFVKADLNYMPEMAEKYSIESVPCLLILQHDVCREKIYAFQSVPYLYEIFKSM